MGGDDVRHRPAHPRRGRGRGGRDHGRGRRSGTVDGGRGALEAVQEPGGIGDARIVVLCDVQTPWERCAEIYGPQKGADPLMVERLAERLDALAAELPRDPRGVAMTGAAGGLSGGLWAALDAALEPGAPYVLDAVRFDARLRGAHGVIAGEGRIDEQSVMGKIVGEIGDRALRAGVALTRSWAATRCRPRRPSASRCARCARRRRSRRSRRRAKPGRELAAGARAQPYRGTTTTGTARRSTPWHTPASGRCAPMTIVSAPIRRAVRADRRAGVVGGDELQARQRP